MTNDTEKEWIEDCQNDAHYILTHHSYPFTQREARILYLGKVAGKYPKSKLENATLDQLIQMYDDYHNKENIDDNS